MYKFYRKLPNGKWKYTEAFNSTLDPNYHELINIFREDKLWIKALKNKYPCPEVILKGKQGQYKIIM